jgi:hypothetical protein
MNPLLINIKKNEDKIKGSIRANAPPEWLPEEAWASST